MPLYKIDTSGSLWSKFYLCTDNGYLSFSGLYGNRPVSFNILIKSHGYDLLTELLAVPIAGKEEIFLKSNPPMRVYCPYIHNEKGELTEHFVIFRGDRSNGFHIERDLLLDILDNMKKPDESSSRKEITRMENILEWL